MAQSSLNLSLEETISQWFVQHSSEIEKIYGIYIDEAVVDFVKQTFSTILHAMKYQSDLIKNNEG